MAAPLVNVPIVHSMIGQTLCLEYLEDNGAYFKMDDINDAIEQAINSKGGDNLINIKWWLERRYWIVGTVDILYVEGTVIRYMDEGEEEEK